MFCSYPATITKKACPTRPDQRGCTVMKLIFKEDPGLIDPVFLLGKDPDPNDWDFYRPCKFFRNFDIVFFLS